MSLVLEQNAFAILDVGIRANAGQIADAHDDRLFDGAAETSLFDARSRLTVARDRIEEEITYLPELAPNRAREVLREIADASTADVAGELVSSLPNLSRANVAADLVGRLPVTAPLISLLVDAHAELDTDGALESLQNARAASGIGPISDAIWSRALAYLRGRHADTLNGALTLSSEGPAILAAIIERMPASSPSEWYRSVIDETVDRYDRWCQPRLVDIEERLDRSIAAVRADPEEPSLLDQVIAILAEWDALSQPVQLRDESKGMDEPKSRRVGGKVRDLAVWLANERDDHESALALSRALEATFPELPGFKHQIAGDIETLDDLIEESRTHRLMQPLAELAAEAESQLGAIGSDIRNGHFSSTGAGLASQLYEAFETSRQKSGQLPNPSLPWLLVRSIAIGLNNDANDPEAALALVNGIITTAPEPVRSRLQEDQAALETRVAQSKLRDAIEGDQLAAAQKQIDLLLARATGAERSDLENLKARIARRQAGGAIRWGWLAFLGLAILFTSISECDKKPTTYSPSDYGESDFSAADEVESNLTEETPVVDDSIDDQAEVPPEAGSMATLTVPQLRYCMFEEERLSYLDPRVPPSAYGQFNARVSDFNSRCNGRSYAVSDRARIGGEVAMNRGTLESEAAAILAGWTRPAPTAPVPVPPVIATNPESPDDIFTTPVDDPVGGIDDPFVNQAGQ